MDFFDNPFDVLAMSALLLVLVINVHQSLRSLPSSSVIDDMDVPEDPPFVIWDSNDAAAAHATQAGLHYFRLFTSLSELDEDLGFWVRPRSTAWFSRFLLREYDDARWVQIFRMTKRALFSLCHILTPAVRKQDTNYRLVVPISVRIACTLFKLSHGANLLICSELFALGRSTVSIMLREVVQAVNTTLRGKLSWPHEETFIAIAARFQGTCGLPGVLGAIDGTHITVKKPKFGRFDYYCFKSGGYSINCQAVTDSDKRFLDVYVGMPGSTNDARMLRRSNLFHRGQHGALWDPRLSFAGFSPYLIGDGGYPLLPWLMVPHRQRPNLSPADQFFNRQLSRGCIPVENAVGQLKLTFRELLVKTNLDVAFVPEVDICCVLLYNILLQQLHADVEQLLQVIGENQVGAAQLLACRDVDFEDHRVPEDFQDDEGVLKRQHLASHLSVHQPPAY